jgi:hypothetical protein
MIHSEANLDYRFIEMMKLLNVYLNHFPKHEKYALCSSIRNTAYEVYDLVVECQKRYHKKTTLVNLDIKHQQLRMKIRLAYELGYFEFKSGKNNNKQNPAVHRLKAISVLVDELGKIVGGWIKFDREGH